MNEFALQMSKKGRKATFLPRMYKKGGHCFKIYNERRLARNCSTQQSASCTAVYAGLYLMLAVKKCCTCLTRISLGIFSHPLNFLSLYF